MPKLSFALMRRNLSTLVLSGLLLLAVAYYTLQVLPAKTSRLQGRYYRVLARIGANLNQQLAAQRKTNEGIKLRLRKHALTRGDSSADVKKYVREYWAKQFSPMWPRPAFEALTPISPPSEASSPQWSVQANQLLFKDTLRLASRPPQTYTVQWSVPLDSVVAPLARPDAFTYFFLLEAHQYRTLYASAPSVLLLDPAKHPLKWVQDSTGLHTSASTALTLQGQDYYLFMVPQQVGSSTWLVCGAVPKVRFDAERQAVSGRTVEMGLLLILLGMLSLPFLKIAFMGPQERLGRADVLRLGVALVFGTGLLVLALQSLAVRHWLEDDLTRQQLEALATEVDERLSREVRALGTTLRVADAQLARRPGAWRPSATGFDSLRYVPLDTSRLTLPAAAWQQLHRQRDSSDILAWLDRNGRARWVLGRKKIDYLTPLNGRDYFQAVGNHPSQYAPADSAATFLGSVVSYRNAQPTAVLARGSRLRLGPSPGVPAVCFMSTDLLCLRQPVLPQGFSFCIMNERGEVLFHSTPRLSLSENLLADCQPDEELRAAIFTRRRQTYEAYYQGHDSRLLIQPLAAAQPGLFVVAIADGSYLRTWQLQTVLAALRLLVGFWLVLGLLEVLWYSLSAAPALSMRIRHSFPRLWPRPAYRRRYAYIAGAHLVGVAALYLVANYLRLLSVLGQLLALLLLPIWLFSLTAVLLRVRADKRLQLPSWLVLVGALALINALAVTYLDATDIWPLVGLQLVLLVVVGGGLLLQEKAALLAPYYTALSAALASLKERFFTPSAPAAPGQPAESHPQWYQLTYPAMLLAWLAVLGLVPAVYCYQLANYCERTVQMRQVHLSLLRQLEASHATASSALPDTASQYLSFYARTGWTAYLVPAAATKGIANNRRFYQWLHSDLDDQHRSQLLPLPSAAAGGAVVGAPDAGSPAASAASPTPENWFVTTKPGSTPAAPTTSYVSQYLRQSRGLRSEADALVSGHALFAATQAPSARHLTLFWLLPVGLAGLVLLLGGLLHYLMRRCFMPAYHAYAYPPPESVPGVRPASAAPVARHRFVLAPAGSTLASLPAAERASLPASVPVLNARKLAQAADWAQWLQQELPPGLPAHRTVVLEELDFRVEDADLTKCKRHVLEQLLGDGWRVVVLSRCHPLALVYCEHPMEPPCQVPSHVSQREAGTALLDALADFRAEYLPLSPVLAPAAPTAADAADARNKLAQECQRLPFLQANQRFLQRLLACHPPQKPSQAIPQAVLLTQRLAQFHYRSLWRRLSPEEQFYLYDMAQDGLVNPHNHHIMETLLQKGYLRFDKHGRLLLFNDSFRQFALSALQQRRVAAYEAEHRQGSTWAAWQLPLMLLLMAGVVFVFVTQRAAMTGAEQFLTAFVTLIPLLGRLLSSFSAPNGPTKAEGQA